MALYNLTFMDTATNIYSVWSGMDAIKPGWFGAFMLFTLFIISMVVFKGDQKKAMFGASFGTLFVSYLMFVNGLIGLTHLGVVALIFIGSLIYFKWGD